jgi:hypothetical protein
MAQRAASMAEVSAAASTLYQATLATRCTFGSSGPPPAASSAAEQSRVARKVSHAVSSCVALLSTTPAQAARQVAARNLAVPCPRSITSDRRAIHGCASGSGAVAFNRTASSSSASILRST